MAAMADSRVWYITLPTLWKHLRIHSSCECALRMKTDEGCCSVSKNDLGSFSRALCKHTHMKTRCQP